MPRRAALLVLCAALALGCKSKPEQRPEPAKTALDGGTATSVATTERIVVEQVAVRRVDPDQPLAIDDRVIAINLARQLSASPWFFAKAEDVPSPHLPRTASLLVELSYDVLEEGSTGAPTAFVAVAAVVDYARDGGPEIRENVVAERPLAKGDRADLLAVFAPHIDTVVAEVGRGLIAKEKLRHGTDDQVVAAITGTDDSLAAWAAELAGDRKLTAAVKPLASLLGKSDALVSAAIPALVAIGDPSAVAPLADTAKFSDLDNMRVVVEAVIALGGDDAIEFLEFVSTGAASSDIKQRAREGLDRLKKRDKR